MKTHPLVSVICTVKNGEKTIKKTMKSVEKQAYENIEMIIVDDGSTDATLKILKETATRNSKIKYYDSGGIGRGNALNKAIDLASGDYVTILDADDEIHPQKIQNQVEIFLSKDVFLVCTGHMIIFNNDEPEWSKSRIENLSPMRIDDRLLRENIIPHSSVMMNKSMLKELGGYDATRKTQLDYELWLRAYTDQLPMLKIRDNLTAKRIHDEQTFENKKRLKYLINAAKLQLKYNIKFKKNFGYLLFLPFKILLQLLPFKTRAFIKNLR